MTIQKISLKHLFLAATLVFALLFSILPAQVSAEDKMAAATDANVSFSAGELKLDSAPHLSFGNHSIPYDVEEISATNISSDIQVADLRGKDIGWALTVALSSFKLGANETETLEASEIHLKNPTVKAVNGTIGTPPTGYSELKLTSDDNVTPIFNAQNSQGMGVWALSYALADAKLLVKPGTAEEGNSIATLTWNLQNTP